MKPLPASAFLLGVVLSGVAFAEDSPALSKPGREMAVIDTPHLHALVPAAEVERLRPKIQRADAIYAHLAADAGYVITGPLTIWVSDDADTHNGFSTTVPRPLVQIELAPSLPRSGIFTGADEFERTITHELAHHISNDRVYGLPRITSAIFGRVFPSDYLSLITAYFTVPPHVTMPLFWHEGLAQWAETAYADQTSPWAGRGRDSMTHLVWRLDAADDAIPLAKDWRASFTQWPYGNRVYLYGAAYTRWLAAAFGDRASLWRISDTQAHTWPFVFDGGAEKLLNRRHGELITAAREALMDEQRAQLAMLRSAPVTELTRLTPVDTLVAAPTWLPDGRCVTAFSDPWATSRLAIVDRLGAIEFTPTKSYDRGEARGLADGTTIFAESVGSRTDQWSRSRLILRWENGRTAIVPGERLLQPDVRPDPQSSGHSALTSWPRAEIAAIHILPGGKQEIVIGTWRDFFFRTDTTWNPFPTVGRAWHPTFRPGHDELLWVETDHDGSRLVLAPLKEPTQRTVLMQVRGRLIHPCWSADGEHIFVCADHTGVPNAYRLDLAAPGILVPVTNVVGAVTACVPSPDGRELALVAFDRHGPFLARIANDPATFATSVPTITLAWPAPVKAEPGPLAYQDSSVARAPTPLPPAADAGSIPVTDHAYWGLRELRFLFWTPSTAVTPFGGLGVQAIAADPLYTHVAMVGAGVGDRERIPVGYAGYTWSPYVLGLRAQAWRAEVTYTDDVLTSSGRLYDYTESQTTVEAGVGWNLSGSERRISVGLALGGTRYREVTSAAERYANETVISVAPFTGNEKYAEATLGYADVTSFPTSFSRENGPTLLASYRVSGGNGLGADLYRKRLVGVASYTWSIAPRWGHQVVGAAYAGWSDPDGATTLQGAFTIGGTATVLTPRGYPERLVSGYYLFGYSGAYRLPVWRPFANFGTTPFGVRQVTLEGFFDAAQVSTDHVHGNGGWFRSTGGELAVDLEIWALRLAPGFGVAHQIDGKEATTAYLRLGYRW